ncbi:MAG: serine/threonine protein kinase [Micrococcales bacterium]|nr:serine/threonine protein kinase [Micrococcales bacterium]MCL2668144.1 serine/threonine protein kinase [Micrococcales bacterium]
MERIGLAPGTAIGGYTVVAPLGSGGMGTVYRVIDDGGNVAALKLLHPEIGADPVARGRLLREVAALQRLRHRAVARVLDAEVDSTEAFLVTELVTGESLDQMLRRRRRPLRATALADLADALADALTAVHEAGVVHRDLKPSNVMMTADGPVLIDFGLARTGDDTPLTATSLVAGSPGFLAPELIDGEEATAAVDWWGWAAVLAYAATGRPPFGTGALGHVLARTRAGEPDLDELPPRTAAMLHWALSADQHDRAAPDDVRAALRTQAEHPDDDDFDDDPDGDRVDPDAETEVIGDGSEPVEDDDPDVGVDGYVRPPAIPRWGALLAGCAVVVGAGAQWPVRTAVVVVALMVVVRTVGLDIEAMHTRRLRKGVSVWDVPRAVVTIPWHFVLSVLGLVPALIISAAAALIVGSLFWVFGAAALSTSDTELAGTAVGVVVGVLVLGFIVGTWFGPLARATRVGARRTLAVVAPGRVGAGALVIACLVAAAVLYSHIGTAPVDWSPVAAPGMPS